MSRQPPTNSLRAVSSNAQQVQELPDEFSAPLPANMTDKELEEYGLQLLKKLPSDTVPSDTTRNYRPNFSYSTNTTGRGSTIGGRSVSSLTSSGGSTIFGALGPSSIGGSARSCFVPRAVCDPIFEHGARDEAPGRSASGETGPAVYCGGWSAADNLEELGRRNIKHIVNCQDPDSENCFEKENIVDLARTGLLGTSKGSPRWVSVSRNASQAGKGSHPFGSRSSSLGPEHVKAFEQVKKLVQSRSPAAPKVFHINYLRFHINGIKQIQYDYSGLVGARPTGGGGTKDRDSYDHAITSSKICTSNINFFYAKGICLEEISVVCSLPVSPPSSIPLPYPSPLPYPLPPSPSSHFWTKVDIRGDFWLDVSTTWHLRREGVRRMVADVPFLRQGLAARGVGPDSLRGGHASSGGGECGVLDAQEEAGV